MCVSRSYWPNVLTILIQCASSSEHGQNTSIGNLDSGYSSHKSPSVLQQQTSHDQFPRQAHVFHLSQCLRDPSIWLSEFEILLRASVEDLFCNCGLPFGLVLAVDFRRNRKRLATLKHSRADDELVAENRLVMVWVRSAIGAIVAIHVVPY